MRSGEGTGSLCLWCLLAIAYRFCCYTGPLECHLCNVPLFCFGIRRFWLIPILFRDSRLVLKNYNPYLGRASESY